MANVVSPLMMLLAALVAVMMMHFFGGAVHAASFGGGLSSNYCAKKLIAEFQFGAAFKPEVESLLNVAFPHKEHCAKFAAFLWTQLEQWSAGIGKWSAGDEAFRRRQASNVLLIAHYRATRGELTAAAATADRKFGLSTEMLQRIEMVLKDPRFEDELFQSSELVSGTSGEAKPLSCSAKVNRTVLKVQTPSSLSSLMTNFSGTGADLWSSAAKEEPEKLIAVQALLRLLYICAKGDTNGAKLIQSKNADVARYGCSDVFASELLLGEIFQGDSSNNELGGGGPDNATGGAFAAAGPFGAAGRSGVGALGNSTGLLGAKDNNLGGGSVVWNVLFWAVLMVSVLIALYLGLRFLEVLPGFGG
ncbi:hypothetical protein TYRP_002596 [Tyrophagus putrescentiae]|nr:hypothetical protein TYRP_002596 [Tyrophagus putrescentiae]